MPIQLNLNPIAIRNQKKFASNPSPIQIRIPICAPVSILSTTFGLNVQLRWFKLGSKANLKGYYGHNGFWSRHLVFVVAQEPYIWRPLKEKPFDLTNKDLGLELTYGLGKVLGIQNRPTLRLASHLVSYVLTLLRAYSIFASKAVFVLASNHFQKSFFVNAGVWYGKWIFQKRIFVDCKI